MAPLGSSSTMDSRFLCFDRTYESQFGLRVLRPYNQFNLSREDQLHEHGLPWWQLPLWNTGNVEMVVQRPRPHSCTCVSLKFLSAAMGLNSGVEFELISQAPGFTPIPTHLVSSFLRATCRIEHDLLGNPLRGTSSVSTTACRPTWSL